MNVSYYEGKISSQEMADIARYLENYSCYSNETLDTSCHDKPFQSE